MINSKKLIVRIIVLSAVIFFVVILGITYRQKHVSKQNNEAVLLVGPPEKQAGLQKELNYAFKQASYIKKGNQLLKENKIDESIEQFKIALSLARSSGTKGIAHICLANAYEKKRDYEKALKEVIVDRDKYVNEWAKEPAVERAKYLEYALKGEYELAVEHAKKALEADAKLPNSPKTGRSDYSERLNDLKAAKDYILSLKQK